ncbi:MAG: hypothetical protein LBD23_15900, partial [Oscillospiraceae bacterium]|nr:hypothetical protein [Oscillospiraceae bacterium]
MNNLLIFSRFPLAIVLFIVFAFIVFYIMTRDRYVIWKISAGLFAFSITAGFSIYTYGYLMNSTGLANVPSAALRGIFSAVRMFFINDDFGHLISETGAEWLTDTIWLYILYWLSHVSALIVIQATLLSLFGRRLIDYCRLRFGSYHEAYIIKGGNKDAIMLGESIATHDNKRKYQDTKRLVIILPEQSNEARELYKETAHFGGIVQTPDSNHDLIYFLSKTGLGKKTRQRKKYYVILMSGNPNIAYDIQTVSDFANEKQVNHECIDIYVLTLTDWDMEEVERITQSKSDISSNHRYPYTLHIVSETDLLIRQMIQNAPPYKSPNFRFLKTGEAAGDYTVMILGFGTLGQRALLRLITNGQFYGSKMKAIVVDKDIKRLNYCFTHRYPGLELCCEIITSDDYVVPCEKFYELLSANDNVNYIVVTFDDYSENHQIAIDIRNYYERKNISNPPFITVYDRTSGLRGVKHDNTIFTFGCRAEIYTESVILR